MEAHCVWNTEHTPACYYKLLLKMSMSKRSYRFFMPDRLIYQKKKNLRLHGILEHFLPRASRIVSQKMVHCIKWDFASCIMDPCLVVPLKLFIACLLPCLSTEIMFILSHSYLANTVDLKEWFFLSLLYIQIEVLMFHGFISEDMSTNMQQPCLRRFRYPCL
jgi:hypothetical protein